MMIKKYQCRICGLWYRYEPHANGCCPVRVGFAYHCDKCGEYQDTNDPCENCATVEEEEKEKI
jgi:hypothetical protein